MKAIVRHTRTGLILVLTAAVCLAAAGTALAYVPETGNGSAVTSTADFQKAKTLAGTDAYQAVPVAAPGGLSTAEIVAISAAVAAAICALAAYFIWRSRRAAAPAVAASPLAAPSAQRDYRKAA